MIAKLRRDPVMVDEQRLGMDFAFLAMLFLTSLTGLLLLVLRATPAMALLLALHLGVVFALFITMPYGKFVHGIYRFAALVRYAKEHRAFVEQVTQEASMPSTVLDSDIFKDMFGTPEMRAVFSDDNLLKCYVEAEVALAVAQGRTGVIPQDAADAIAKAGATVTLDRDALKAEAENVGYPILGLVRQLSAKLGEAGRYVHWGATTQDIMDTATVLQIRAALAIVERDMAAVSAALARLAEKHRDTPMPGRTHLQQALPITFGYKCAIWLAAMDRHAERLRELKPRVLVAQLGGAAGTLASLGDKGLDVRREFARELKLGDPPITWHVARDAVVETVNFLGLVTGSLGKIGFDIMLMMMTELGEAFEPFASHRGASSTMPQKRNPISSEILVANAKAVRQHCRPDARRHDPGFRARHRPVARRVDGDPGKLHPHGRLARAGEVHARRAGGR